MINRQYSLGKNLINTTSSFNTGTIVPRRFLLEQNNKKVLLELEAWEDTNNGGKKFDFYVYDNGLPSIFANNFSYVGLADTFSKLKNVNDINEFANKYGLLGFAHPNTIHVELSEFLEAYNEDKPELSSYGVGALSIEPLEQWFACIQTVRNLMKLYRILKKHNGSEEIESESDILTFEEFSNDLYRIVWHDGNTSSILLSANDIERLGSVGIYRKVLIDTINLFLKDSIQYKIEPIESSKTPLGFYIVDIPTTQTLWSAIFYDFKNMLEQDTNIILCANKQCRIPFVKYKKQIYCSNACKQEAYRIRKEEKTI